MGQREKTTTELSTKLAKLESEYKNNASLEHRKKHGQFFTPSHIARLMAQWLLKGEPKTILDPAFGLGVFYDEIKSLSNSEFKYYGYEIDSEIISYLNNYQNNKNLVLYNLDYLKSKLTLYDAIICNPPYMRFQKFINRHQVLPILERQLGIKINGYSNMAAVFLLKALNQLNKNGRLAFIMPFEFFNTGYGKKIKESLINNYLLKQIIIINNEKDIFPEATTTICILFCENNFTKQAVKITKLDANTDIQNIADINQFYQKEISLDKLQADLKWTPILFSLFSDNPVPKGFVNLSFYGKFTRGLATGANKFFALRKSDLQNLGLDISSTSKCITKSFQINRLVFNNNDFDALYNADDQVNCLDIQGQPSKAEASYIKYGELNKYNDRYLTRKRSPWYKLEIRKPAPILCGVFNRGRIKVIRNLTNALSFTCFHSFYPNESGQIIINKIFVYMLSDIGQSIISLNKRSYGDNLDKFEPGDLNQAFVPGPSQFDLLSDKEAQTVIDIASNNSEKAIAMSNILVKRILDFGVANCASKNQNSKKLF